MIIAAVQFLSIVCYIRLCAVCLYEWSRLSCQSYASWPILHVTIHLAQPLSTICYIRCMYLMLVWKMLPVFLAYLPCPYTIWKRMILPSDQLLPTVCYMWCIYWVFVSLTSPVSSFIDVLFYCTCPYTHWKRMILPIDQRLSTLWYIRWTYLMFIWMISTILSIINALSYYISLYTLKTNDLTPWSTFIKCMLYYMHVFCVCMNDRLDNYMCVVLFYMSLYTLKTNDLTRWSTFTNNMLY